MQNNVIYISMKNGIILAGGTGSRLFPLTHVINKHLLGINGQFIIDYPINTLKQMGVENVTVILGGAHFSQVVGYLQDGSRYGMNFNYVYQGEPKELLMQSHYVRSKYLMIMNLPLFLEIIFMKNQLNGILLQETHKLFYITIQN